MWLFEASLRWRRAVGSGDALLTSSLHELLVRVTVYLPASLDSSVFVSGLAAFLECLLDFDSATLCEKDVLNILDVYVRCEHTASVEQFRHVIAKLCYSPLFQPHLPPLLLKWLFLFHSQATPEFCDFVFEPFLVFVRDFRGFGWVEHWSNFLHIFDNVAQAKSQVAFRLLVIVITAIEHDQLVLQKFPSDSFASVLNCFATNPTDQNILLFAQVVQRPSFFRQLLVLMEGHPEILDITLNLLEGALRNGRRIAIGPSALRSLVKISATIPMDSPAAVTKWLAIIFILAKSFDVLNSVIRQALFESISRFVGRELLLNDYGYVERFFDVICSRKFVVGLLRNFQEVPLDDLAIALENNPQFRARIVSNTSHEEIDDLLGLVAQCQFPQYNEFIGQCLIEGHQLRLFLNSVETKDDVEKILFLSLNHGHYDMLEYALIFSSAFTFLPSLLERERFAMVLERFADQPPDILGTLLLNSTVFKSGVVDIALRSLIQYCEPEGESISRFFFLFLDHQLRNEYGLRQPNVSVLARFLEKDPTNEFLFELLITTVDASFSQFSLLEALEPEKALKLLFELAKQGVLHESDTMMRFCLRNCQHKIAWSCALSILLNQPTDVEDCDFSSVVYSSVVQPAVPVFFVMLSVLLRVASCLPIHTFWPDLAQFCLVLLGDICDVIPVNRHLSFCSILGMLGLKCSLKGQEEEISHVSEHAFHPLFHSLNMLCR
jgi:hypothetical protein